jgi:hypothetical protein
LKNRHFKQQRPHDVYELAASLAKPLRITSAVSSASLSVDSSWRHELDLPIAYTSAFLRVPMPVRRAGWQCHSCDAEWADDGVEGGRGEARLESRRQIAATFRLGENCFL